MISLKNMDQQKRLKIILALVFVFSLILVVLLITAFSGKDQDPTAGRETVPPQSSAAIGYKDLPYLPGDTPAVKEAIREDLAFFARENYSAYKKDKNLQVLFTVTSEPKEDDTSVSFSGTYDKSKNNVTVEIKFLRNDRIKTSIKDTVTGTSIDDKLPSASTRNIFIGTLPVDQGTYMIDFAIEPNTFIITNNDGTEATTKAAEAFLTSSLKLEDLSSERYSVIFSRSSGTGEFPSFD